MPTVAGAEFKKIFNWDGGGTTSAHYTDVTLEAQSPAGTSFTILNTAPHYLYLGNDYKFDLAVFDVVTAGGVGALTCEFHNGTTWTEFIPGSGRYELDPDDDQGAQYNFREDGAEIFPPNILNTWATVAVNSVTHYWVRVSTASVSVAPTIKRIQMRPYSAYCTSKDVFQLLQLGNITGTSDFTTATTPTQATVEQYILESQSFIDFTTRKSWRPNYVVNEYQPFNLNGFKLDKPDAYKIIKLEIWNGGGWDTKRQGRTKDYFLVPDTGMVQFSRYFLLPARFTSYNAPVWRWGGGEFTMPIKVTYLAGRDLQTDIRQGGIITDCCKKLTAIDVMRDADFGNLVVSGMDRVQMSQRIEGWTQEVEDRLDSLRAFEVF